MIADIKSSYLFYVSYLCLRHITLQMTLSLIPHGTQQAVWTEWWLPIPLLNTVSVRATSWIFVHSLGWSLNNWECTKIVNAQKFMKFINYLYINAGVIYSRFTSQLTPTNLLLPAPAPIMNPPGSSALSAMSLKL